MRPLSNLKQSWLLFFHGWLCVPVILTYYKDVAYKIHSEFIVSHAGLSHITPYMSEGQMYACIVFMPTVF